MFTATAIHSSTAVRPPKPRAYVVPVVRPVPPRPAGAGMGGTW